MGRTAKHGLSKHSVKGFRLSIGKRPDGGYKTFWLGHAVGPAHEHAERLRLQFGLMQQEGRDVWTHEDETSVKQQMSQYNLLLQRLKLSFTEDAARVQQNTRTVELKFGPADAPAKQKKSSHDAKTTLTLYAAIDVYLAGLEQQAVSSAHKERTRQLLADLKHYRPDCLLADIDRVWLQTLTDFIKSRPKSRVRKTPLAPLTVRNTLQAWSRFFDWIDANADSPRFGGWQAPRRAKELFEVKLSKLMTKAERDAHADGPKQLTPQQVVRLYRAARNDLHRICILLGVFAALGQKEIATLRRDEFNLAKGLLTHRRSKTGQKGQFHLPAEAVKLIKRYFRDVSTTKAGVTVSQIVPRSEAIRLLGTDDIWDAPFVAIASTEGTTMMDYDRTVPINVAQQLRFDASGEPRGLVLEGDKLYRQTLRRVRRLTPESADTLSQLIAAG